MLVELLLISFILNLYVYIHWFLYFSHVISHLMSFRHLQRSPTDASAMAAFSSTACCPLGPTVALEDQRGKESQVVPPPKKSNIDTKNGHIYLKGVTFSLNIILGIHVGFQGYKGSFPNYPANKNTSTLGDSTCSSSQVGVQLQSKAVQKTYWQSPSDRFSH